MTLTYSETIITPEPPESKINQFKKNLAEVEQAIASGELSLEELKNLDERFRKGRKQIKRTINPNDTLNNPDADSFEGGVRGSLLIANKLEELDPTLRIRKETTGDPVAHKWDTPQFVKNKFKEYIDKPYTLGYADSTGNKRAREIACDLLNFHGSKLTPDDILFSNGVAHFIKTLMEMGPRDGLVLQPSPTYPCYSSIGEFLTEGNSAYYVLDPKNGWAPDTESMEEEMKKNPDIYAILLINPNNPTGGVYDRETLARIVDIAKRHNKMIISDEIYCNLTLGENNKFISIAEIADNQVPLIVLRGTSKDLLVPGIRGGYGAAFDGGSKDFANFFKSMKGSIRAEVGANVLPQYLMELYPKPEFQTWRKEFTDGIQSNVDHIMKILGPVKGIKVIPPKGAFYVWVTFEEGVLNDRQSLPLDGLNPAARDYLLSEINKPGLPLDKRFLLHLMGNAKLCVVPGSDLKGPAGFRVTALERNDEEREIKFRSLATAIEQYLSSSN